MPERKAKKTPPRERPRVPWALLATLAAALALRLWHLGQGLPEFTEEAVPFRKALEMWKTNGSVDWNPHLFHYPSVTIYLHLLIQKLTYLAGHMIAEYKGPADFLLSFHIDPGAMVLPARLLGVAADLVTVLCVARIAERLRPGAGVLAAILTACASTMIRASRAIFTDTVMTALAVAALDRMLAWRASAARGSGATPLRRRGTLMAAAVLIGLAAGAKYPAAILLLPLAWVLWERMGARAIVPWGACALGALGVFLLTTPYALLDWTTFSRDFVFVSRIGSAGHLGNIDRPGFRFHLEHLRADVGWLGLGLLLVSLVLTVARPRYQAGAAPVWLAGLAFGVPIAFAHVLADRYLVPVIPIAAVLISAAALALVSRLPRPASRFALPVAVIVVALPTVIGGVRAAASGSRSTQTEARRWCEAHLTRDQLLVQELYGAPLLTRLESLAVQSRPVFRDAALEMQERYRELPWFSSVTLPLAVVGDPRHRIRAHSGETVELPVYPHTADINQACYDPRLLAGADYMLTTALVRGRFEADSGRYSAQMRFYALLDSTAELAARFVPGRGQAGPEIKIYRLGPPAHAAIAALGPLDPLWWAAFVPDDYRRRAASLMSAPGHRPNVALRDSAGTPRAWVMSLRDLFRLRYAPLARSMALELIEHRRFEPALRFAQSLIELQPEDVQATLMFVGCARQLGAWESARAALERCISSSAPGAPSPYLTLEYADVLAHDGEIEQARSELTRALAAGDAYVAGEARRRLDDPRGPFGQGRASVRQQ